MKWTYINSHHKCFTVWFRRAARAVEDESASADHTSEGASGEVERTVKRVLEC